MQKKKKLLAVYNCILNFWEKYWNSLKLPMGISKVIVSGGGAHNHREKNPVCAREFMLDVAVSS